VLLQQIQQRPGNTRVFCIGVGNDVNRPLLEQLAEDSGGLSAFISAGDQGIPVPSSRTRSNPGQSRDIEIPGTGPIGPLGVLVSFWLLRLKRKSA
jgi:hypothetical protein